MILHGYSAGAGPDVVLLHGWALHGGVWRETAEHLAARRRVTVIDLPGHGHSGPLGHGDYTLEQVTAALAPALPERSTVVGWSLGGTVALALALRYPHCVERLALVAATPQFVAGGDWPHALEPEVVEGFACELEQDYQRTLQRFLALQVLKAEAGRGTLARLTTDLAAAPPSSAALHGGLRILGSASLVPALSAVTQPTALIFGERDTLVPAAAARALRDRLPRAELHLIPGAGHAPFLSHPAAFRAALDGFLDG